MTATFDKLKALLAEKKDLSSDEMTAAIAATGEMTQDEITWLESEKIKLQRGADAKITMEQYLEASKVLDTADPGSDEYKKAEELVNKYEAGM
jgi:hypothetical protein